jgi:Bacterial aa3 type cytochrome c oxidase subunit IV
MAEHHDTAPAELGAPMDYNEHEKTYDLFIALSKWGAVVCIALVAAMAFGFFAGGFFSATILFILICGSFCKHAPSALFMSRADNPVDIRLHERAHHQDCQSS